MTDNRQHRHIDIDGLRLSDSAIDVLKSIDLNNRLVSELISHPDFPRLMSAMEIYIDRKIQPQMNILNAIYKVTENTIKDKFSSTGRDEVLTLLNEAVLDDDEYLRFRITKRFDKIIKSIYDTHKSDIKPDDHPDFLNEIKNTLQDYPLDKNDDEKAKWKLVKLARQIGLDLKTLTDDETKVLINALQKSKSHKQLKRRNR